MGAAAESMATFDMCLRANDSLNMGDEIDGFVYNAHSALMALAQTRSCGRLSLKCKSDAQWWKQVILGWRGQVSKEYLLLRFTMISSISSFSFAYKRDKYNKAETRNACIPFLKPGYPQDQTQAHRQRPMLLPYFWPAPACEWSHMVRFLTWPF